MRDASKLDTIRCVLFLIWSIEHTAWWRPGRTGYTQVLAEAGQYARDEAEAIVADANYAPHICHECLIPIAAVGLAPVPASDPPPREDPDDPRRWFKRRE